jgi:signal transduction histidine kinase
MTSLLTIANLLKSESDQLQPDHVEYTEHMIGTLNRMNQMINRTLDIKASEAKDLQINWQAVNLAKVVGKVAENFQDRANQKEIELRLELEDSHVEVDTNYTEQVVENLISNALKFSPKGKTIYIKVTKSDSKAKIEIIDEGPGIHENDMEKLFGKYQKLSAQPTDGEKSTGLGLSIVKKYVEAMRGSVWCESKLEKGANFMVEFEIIVDE